MLLKDDKYAVVTKRGLTQHGEQFKLAVRAGGMPRGAAALPRLESRSASPPREASGVALNSVEQALEQLRAGRPIVVIDDENLELFVLLDCGWGT